MSGIAPDGSVIPATQTKIADSTDQPLAEGLYWSEEESYGRETEAFFSDSAATRQIQRACDGAVVMRTYSVIVAERLRRESRVIRV
jgi:hypothetical protein